MTDPLLLLFLGRCEAIYGLRDVTYTASPASPTLLSFLPVGFNLELLELRITYEGAVELSLVFQGKKNWIRDAPPVSQLTITRAIVPSVFPLLK